MYCGVPVSEVLISRLLYLGVLVSKVLYLGVLLSKVLISRLLYLGVLVSKVLISRLLYLGVLVSKGFSTAAAVWHCSLGERLVKLEGENTVQCSIVQYCTVLYSTVQYILKCNSVPYITILYRDFRVLSPSCGGAVVTWAASSPPMYFTVQY